MLEDSGFATSTNEQEASTDGSVYCSDKPSRNTNKLPVFSSTSVEVRSTDRRGKRESMKAILESTSLLQGSIQMDGMKNLSLTLNYKKPEPKETMEDLQERRSENKEAIDEFELMKDCSEETVTNSAVFARYLMKEESFEGSSAKELINITDVCKTETYEYSSLNTGSVQVCSDGSSSSGNEGSSSTYVITQQMENLKLEDPAVVEETESVLDQLRQVTSDLDETLNQPGGKASIITSLKKIYGSSLGRLLYGRC